MGLYVGLLSGPLDPKVMSEWVTTRIFQDFILHAEELRNVNLSKGQLSADPFMIPAALDVKLVKGLVLFDGETCEVSSYGFQVPALGLSCLEGMDLLCLSGWCEEAPVLEQYDSDCSLLDDPCALYEELRCCLFRLVKEQEKVMISFKDRSVRFQPRSENDKDRLERMMLQAKAECEACEGRMGSRGGHLGHSCEPRFFGRRRGCGC